MKIEELKAENIKKAITHSGKFHADDVFSTAFLRLMNPAIELVRTLDIPSDFDGIVYDIGGGRFDHHQECAEVRDNGIPYAAFGLLWREFSVQWLLENDTVELAIKDAEFLDEKFVQPLDLHDNTGAGHPIANIVSNMNPCWDEDGDWQSRLVLFWNAVAFAEMVLTDMKRNILAERKSHAIVVKALEQSHGGVVVLNEYLPWKFALAGSGAKFVVYPSQRGGYSAQHVSQIDENGEKGYVYFPKAWRGKENANEISGVETLRFCHNSGFLIATESLEDAVKACEIAIEFGEME